MLICVLFIYILCVCVCVFPVLPLSYLIIMLIHKTLKRQPICVTHLLNWIDIEWLRHTKKYKHSEEWAVNSPHYKLFFWTISRFKARILTKKRDNSHKNKFYNKIKLFFSQTESPRPTSSDFRNNLIHNSSNKIKKRLLDRSVLSWSRKNI